jgi:hypothetical protein
MPSADQLIDIKNISGLLESSCELLEPEYRRRSKS